MDHVEGGDEEADVRAGRESQTLVNLHSDIYSQLPFTCSNQNVNEHIAAYISR